MSKYRKIEASIWNDSKFMALTDQAKLLFFYLLTNQNLTALGAMKANTAGLATDLKWEQEQFDRAFNELTEKAMVKFDMSASFLLLPNFLKYNKPESPNVVKSWANWLVYLPECELKDLLIEDAKKFVCSLGKAFADALPVAFGDVLPEGLLENGAQDLRKPSLNHEHEHEGELEPEHEKKPHTLEYDGAV